MYDFRTVYIVIIVYEFRTVNHFSYIFKFSMYFFRTPCYNPLVERMVLAMGDGQRLKEILEQKGKSVRWVARETTISPTTIYSIIQKDTSIRFDFALRIANALGIEVSEICSDASLNSENWDKNDSITLPELPSGMDEILDGNRIKRYLKNTLYPLMCLFGKNNMPKLDEHLTNYYQLSDEGRNDVDQYIKAQLSIKRDPDRAADIKKITKW